MSAPWFLDARVLFVAGKGGVGKTTTAAVIAAGAATRGADVLVISVDGRPGLGPLLGGPPLQAEAALLRHRPGEGAVRGRTIPPELAFSDYLSLRRAGGVLRRAANAASLDVLAAGTPGLQHLLVLGKIKELERERVVDLIVVDAPPAGRAAPFLRSASALQEIVPTGPLRDQADEVGALLEDRRRAQATLVTLAEETPVSEVVELAFDIEDRIGIGLTPVVVNACWPERPGLDLSPAEAAEASGQPATPEELAPLERVARFVGPRLAQQRDQRRRLAEQLPLPQIAMPHLGRPDPGPADIDRLARALTEEEA